MTNAMGNKINQFEKEMKDFKGKTVNMVMSSQGINFYKIYEDFIFYQSQDIEFIWENKDCDLSEGSIIIKDIKDLHIERNFEDEVYQIEVIMNNDMKILFELGD